MNVQRFWDKVDRWDPDWCWEWTGATNSKGYGWWDDGTKNHMAHRRAFELLVGPIPEGLTLDHLCRNKLCVNPKHLEPVTRRENILRGDGPTARNARKTHCVHGHALTGDNIFRYQDLTSRWCRECRRIRDSHRVRVQQASS